MSINMPTLFDDEEYFVPPPKKESRNKKDLPEAKDEVLQDAETEAAATPDVPSETLAEAGVQAGEDITAEETVPETPAPEQPVEAVIKEGVSDITPEPEADTVLPEAIIEEVAEPAIPEAPEVAPLTGVTTEAPAETTGIAATEVAITSEVREEPETGNAPRAETVETADEAVEPAAVEDTESNASEDNPGQTTEGVVPTAAPESELTDAQILADEIQEAIEIAAEQSIELEKEETSAEPIVADPFREVVEVSMVDELTTELPKVTPGITFEIPEEDETPAIELEMTARPIPTVKEDKVDDLDQLMRTELISQDYTAFSGFTFEPEPEKKKITPEPEAEVAEEPPKAPGKADISLAAQDIDAAALDFEFESGTLASSLPEFDLENKYYTIGEVAALFAVNVSHIRFWTTEFNLKVRTTRKGDRLYNPENIARLRLIHHLVKENGFTIKGAKDKLKYQKQNVSSQVDLKNKLSGLKDKLERIKKNL